MPVTVTCRFGRYPKTGVFRKLMTFSQAGIINELLGHLVMDSPGPSPAASRAASPEPRAASPEPLEDLQRPAEDDEVPLDEDGFPVCFSRHPQAFGM